MLKIMSIDPRADERWLRLAQSPTGSLFTSPPWIRAVSTTYGFTPEARVAVEPSSAPTAGFAWVTVDDLRGRRSISLPFSDRAEPIDTGAELWRELARDCLDGETPLVVRCFADAPIAGAPEMTPVGQVAWHGTPLAGSLTEVEARFSDHHRRNIRLAHRRGVKVVASPEPWAVREFHRLHVQLRKRKYRLLAQPIDLLEWIREEFSPHNGFVTFLAYLDDEAIASAIYLVWDNVLYYKFGASNVDALGGRPNHAIASAAIEWAVDRGLALLDWGMSGVDQPGLIAYKRRWGGVERRIATWRSRPAAETEADRLLRDLTHVLTGDDVPDAVAAGAGALLYRYFC